MRHFFGCVVPDVHNKLCQLWSYWVEFHEIFTQYRGIICAVNTHIEVAIPILFWNDRVISAGEYVSLP